MEGAELHERGTWMGVSREKRFAVLTNYRTHPHEHKKNPKTRGEEQHYYTIPYRLEGIPSWIYVLFDVILF